MSDDRIAALRAALDSAPDNVPLREMLAEALTVAGDHPGAADQYLTLFEAGTLRDEVLVAAGRSAIESGRLDFARRCLDAARQRGVVEGVADLAGRINENMTQRGVLRLAASRPAVRPPGALREETQVTFADVGGLEGVKKTIHRMIVLPIQRPDLFKKYGKRTGGGVLMYGPPGCGKTLLARATAGECGLPFFMLRLEDILDPWFGVSERNLHQAFETARSKRPCVIFIDELDGIGYARRKHLGEAGRALVDQLLQEIDATGPANEALLVLAATNAPWDVDDALKRPGRFDRMVFVPPPDAVAREHILRIVVSEKPHAALDLQKLARRTPLFSGADLSSAVERAVDAAIEDALAAGGDQPLEMRHLEQALTAMRPTTLGWLDQARTYVEFANQGELYNDVAAFLASPEARR
jgi:transitional endoplasmic reticulum ATPase